MRRNNKECSISAPVKESLSKDEPFWSKPKEDDNINYSLDGRIEIEKEGKNRERTLNRTTLRALSLCASKIDQRINYRSCGCGFV